MEIIVILIFFGIIAAAIANSKGRSGIGWFFLGLLFGPFSLAVALLPSLKATPVIITPHSTTDLRPCPVCAELIQKSARKCRFCNSEILPLKDLPCFHCGTLNVPNANFCESCGKNPHSYF